MIRRVLSAVLLLSIVALPCIALADDRDDYRKAKDLLDSGDVREGLAQMSDLAKKGNLDAINMMGNISAGDYGTKPNFENANTMWRIAADKGNGPAQYNLGLSYEKGRGIKQDYKLAAKYYRMAAEQGFYWPMYRYALLLDQGLGVARDLKEAAEWYEKSAKNGHAPAAYAVGKMYADGRGVTQDNKKAIGYLLLAGKQGYKDAMPLAMRMIAAEETTKDAIAKTPGKNFEVGDGPNPFKVFKQDPIYQPLQSKVVSMFGVDRDLVYVHLDESKGVLDVGVDFWALTRLGRIPWEGAQIQDAQEQAKIISRAILEEILISPVPKPRNAIRATLVGNVIRSRGGYNGERAYVRLYGRALSMTDSPSGTGSDAARAAVGQHDYKHADGLLIFKKEGG